MKAEQYHQISKHTLFKNIHESKIEQFIQQCELKHYQKGDRLTYFKTSDEGILIVLEGKIDVFIEREDRLSVLLEVLQEGEMLGLSHIAHYLGERTDALHQHHFELEIVEDSYCLQVPGFVIKERLVDASVKSYLLGKAAARLGNIYATLGEQVKFGNTWGESESFIRKAKDFMHKPVITIQSNMSIQEVALLMIEKSISSVLVVDQQEQLIGIITEKDLVQRVLSKGLSIQAYAISIMTKSPFTVSPQTHYYNVLATFLIIALNIYLLSSKGE